MSAWGMALDLAGAGVCGALAFLWVFGIAFVVRLGRGNGDAD